MSEESYPWVYGSILTYKFSVHHARVCELFNASYPQGVEAEIERGQYEMEEKTHLYTLYRSTFMNWPYLLTMTLDRFTVVFLMPDDESLMHFKREYSYATQTALKSTFIPPAPAPLDRPIFKMNLKALNKVPVVVIRDI